MMALEGRLRGRRASVAAVILSCALTATGRAEDGGSPEPTASRPPELHPATAAQVLEAVRRPGARAVLVNVWATWCLPCREEFPDILRLYRKHRESGLRLILVSGDFDDDREKQVGKFLAEHGVDFPSYLKEGDDMEFIDTLDPRWSGALPATFIYDSTGALRHFWEGKASYSTIKEKVLEVLGPPSSKKEAS